MYFFSFFLFFFFNYFHDLRDFHDSCDITFTFSFFTSHFSSHLLLIICVTGEWIWDTKVPVGAVWKLLPWNKGRSATCNIKCKYVDDDFRVMEDNDKELFVYTRPVCPRPQ